jgi:hypothetical protein
MIESAESNLLARIDSAETMLDLFLHPANAPRLMQQMLVDWQ